jgi:hypothetical protein
MFALQLFRATLLGGGGLALANSVAISYEGGHKVGTYIAWYALAALLLLAGLAFWLELHRRQSAPGAVSLLEVDRDESINITTHNQSGGTNIGKVSIDRPQPDIIGGETVAHHEKTDAGYRSVAAIQLRDQFAAQALEVVVVGSTVTGLEVNADSPSSIQAQSEEPLTPQRAGVAVHPPLHDRYIVTVTTERPDPNLKIHAQLR